MNVRSLLSLVKCLLFSLIVSLAAICALALLFCFVWLPQSQLSLLILAVYLLACLCGGFLLGKLRETRRTLWGLLFGTLYSLLLTGLSLICGGNPFQELSRLLLCLACCCGGGFLGGFLS